MFYTLMFISLIFAEANSINSDDLVNTGPGVIKEKLLYQLKQYEAGGEQGTSGVLEELESLTTQYVSLKKAQCSGRYSTLNLSDRSSKQIKNKLSKAEKKLCLLELVNLQRRYTVLKYKLIKNQLEKNHQEALSQLEQSKSEQIKAIDKLAAKYK